MNTDPEQKPAAQAMNWTPVLVIAAVLVFVLMPFSAVLAVATVWLLREAHVRRVSGREFTAVFRSLLWAAAVFSGLLGIAAGVLSVLVLMEKNSGWGGILLFFSVPICLLVFVGTFAFGWYARYRPATGAQAHGEQP